MEEEAVEGAVEEEAEEEAEEETPSETNAALCLAALSSEQSSTPKNTLDAAGGEAQSSGEAGYKRKYACCNSHGTTGAKACDGQECRDAGGRWWHHGCVIGQKPAISRAKSSTTSYCQVLPPPTCHHFSLSISLITSSMPLLTLASPPLSSCLVVQSCELQNKTACTAKTRVTRQGGPRVPLGALNH